MKELNDIVGKNLADLRKSRHLTQQELAEQIGYSDKSISKWELGKAIPTVDILKDFSNFYGVTIDFIVSERKPGEEIHQLTKNSKKRNNQIIITAMAACVVWFTAAAIYASNILNGYDTGENLWIAFVWAIPVTFFVCGILARFFWKRSTTLYVFESLFIWTLLAAFFLQFFFYPPHENLWYIFLVCIPLQIGIILITKLK